MNIWIAVLLGIVGTLMIDGLATYLFIKKARKDQGFAEAVICRLAYLLKVPVMQAPPHIAEAMLHGEMEEPEEENPEYLN